MKDKQTRLTIILVIVTILVVVITFIINKNNQTETINKINIVTNYSNFYTVDSCLFRTVTYLATKDKSKVNLILNDDYKKKNNIKESDVLSVFPNIDENYVFASKKMYYENLENNIVKYYVYGTVIENKILDDDLITSEQGTDLYFIVYIDTEGSLFSVEPYDGEIFIGGVDNEK